jgi:hypothetical protein
MTDSQGKEMALVFDLRRDQRCREQLLSRLEEEWQAYLRGERPVSIAEGYISELFFAPYEGECMFRLREGTRQSSWVRHGDESWYVVGRTAKVESVVLHVPHPIGNMPLVTRIWIGRDAPNIP